MPARVPVSILISPLDWGLGHATRCIPVIRQLIQQGATVTIAAGPAQTNLLKPEFPTLRFLDLPGYNLTYKQGLLLKWALILRIPGMRRQMKKEKAWLEKTVLTYSIEGVISDNRYGLHHHRIPSYFITHQLQIQSGLGYGIDRLLLKWNYHYIDRFSACWVPDAAGEQGLAGRLSHPSILPVVQTTYIGMLSRFEKSLLPVQRNTLLILISGPEPQRSVLEQMLLKQVNGYEGTVTIVRGLPGSPEEPTLSNDRIKIFNHLESEALSRLMSEAEVIVARSGYSTVMDLVKMGRPAILIPTPGQTEQEYLGRYLSENKWMYTVRQRGFNLTRAIAGFHVTALSIPPVEENLLSVAIAGFLQRCANPEV